MRFSNKELKEEIIAIKNRLSVTIAAHFYQKDEVYEMADITGDSLQLAQQCCNSKSKYILFCGVGFMGESVKILSPQKHVVMPKIACCSMARMISCEYFDDSINFLKSHQIAEKDIMPVTYINSSAEVKAKVGKMDGYVCTSSNAKTIITNALSYGKKILFLPDKCLGENIAIKLGLKSSVIGDGKDPNDVDIVCYNGFCSVHQLFELDDIEFYRKKFPGIKIISHPECKVEVCQASDFVGSTSQLIKYVKDLDIQQKVAVATEFNLVNRLRKTNTYVLSSTKPECPTMNETTLRDVYVTLKAIENNDLVNEIFLEKDVQKYAKIALEKMMNL